MLRIYCGSSTKFWFCGDYNRRKLLPPQFFSYIHWQLSTWWYKKQLRILICEDRKTKILEWNNNNGLQTTTNLEKFLYSLNISIVNEAMAWYLTVCVCVCEWHFPSNQFVMVSWVHYLIAHCLRRENIIIKNKMSFFPQSLSLVQIFYSRWGVVMYCRSNLSKFPFWFTLIISAMVPTHLFHLSN